MVVHGGKKSIYQGLHCTAVAHWYSHVKNVLIAWGIHSKSAFYPGNCMLVSCVWARLWGELRSWRYCRTQRRQERGKRGEKYEKTERWQLCFVTVLSLSLEIQLHRWKPPFWKDKIQEKEAESWAGFGEVGENGGWKQELLSMSPSLQYIWGKIPTFRKWF